MACTINKVKHLFWYMVLATVVVASQYAPANAREKRQSRLSSSITEKSYGGDEERVTPFELNFGPTLENTFETSTSGATVDKILESSLWPPSENTIEASLATGNGADKKAKKLPKSAALATGDEVEANEKILGEGASIIAAAKKCKVPTKGQRNDGEAPVPTKGQRNDGEAPVPTKGQRNDDDQ
ncbi:unnamed protein product [Peronospora farinosa]|uniref:Uncharacterized protein n=1 Tax=Peronospora farinosa TaxID=134698 RepID=A0AAV0SXW1_9STRA|nr:unnamed protein product [Peronospora farinosa]